MYPFENPKLPLQERVRDLLCRLTTEEKIGLLSTHNLPIERLGIGEWYIGHEIARGLVNREAENPSTVFPQPIGMAASFDKAMMRQIGETAAREARAYYNERKTGGLMVWGPTVDLSRDPRWGRNEECYGEDPCLTGEMAAQYTLGLRGDGDIWATIPTLKHFCANNHEQNRAVDNANLDPRLKQEHYYAAFRTPVKYGGAHAVMTAYNEINHAPAVMNHDLKDVLKADWGLGFVVTDGADFSQNVTAHGTFPSHAAALKACLNAGADIMTDVDECVHAAARKALAEGLITEADLDLAVGNMLESRFRLGHFDAQTPFDALTRADVNTDADKALNRRAAREGMVLLENRGNALPLDPEKHRKIALFGANADVNLMDWYTGTSSYLVSIKKGLEERGVEVVYDSGWDIVTLQAPNGKFLCIGEDDCLYADTDEANAAAFYLCEHDDEGRWTNLCHVPSGRFVTLDGAAPHLGKTEIYGWFTGETLRMTTSGQAGCRVFADYLHGRQLTLDANARVVCREQARPDDAVRFRMVCTSVGADRIAALTKGCDAVIYCGGNDPEQVARECFDRRTIRLPGVQRKAVRTLAQALEPTGTPLLLTLVSSYPYALGEVQQIPDAILWTTHAGAELGHAFAETIFGESNPAGRLPQTWYADDEQLAPIGDYDIVKNRMTYRWFDGEALYPFGYGLSYAKFRYDAMEITRTEDGFRVSAAITNESDRDGEEVVQLYAHARSTRIPRPLRQLIAFGRIFVPAGKTVQAELFAPSRELLLWDVSRDKWVLETGDYDFCLGASSQDIRLSQTLPIEGETVPPRDVRTFVQAVCWDRQCGTEIRTDPMTGETHIRGMAWENEVVYQNCDLTGIRTLRIRACAPVGNLPLRCCLDGNPVPFAEVTVPARDGFTDFTEVTVPLEADGCHDLHLAFGEGLCLAGFAAE